MKSKEALEKLSTKQVAIELFNIVSNGKYDTNDLVPYFDRIDKALTELEEIKRYPTADEVCEALSEYFAKETIYDKQFKEFRKGFRVVANPRENIYNEYDLLGLPPHLITLIGRFYEGLEKAGKEE